MNLADDVLDLLLGVGEGGCGTEDEHPILALIDGAVDWIESQPRQLKSKTQLPFPPLHLNMPGHLGPAAHAC